jgi:hypothetical protein
MPCLYWFANGYVFFLTMNTDLLTLLWLARAIRTIVPGARLFIGDNNVTFLPNAR